MTSNTGAGNHFLAELLAENLKALNAKERDHLMRLAYLGEDDCYNKEIERWLSPKMEDLLRRKADLPSTATCVFAGMDYHLDWVFAALKFSCEGRRVAEVSKSARFRCDDGQEENFQAHNDLVHVPPEGDCGDATLLPVSGRQEDVDLLVLFADGNKACLLFIEAKGAASFDRNQLARKLIRLDCILERSRAKALGGKLACALVLVAPGKPQESTAFKIALRCSKEKLRKQLDKPTHRAGIGSKEPFDFIELAGFPKSVAKVTRIPIPNQRGVYTHWRLAKRNGAGATKKKAPNQ